jgi:hypothetical protein
MPIVWSLKLQLWEVEEMTDSFQKPTIPRITGTGAFLDLILARR